MKIAVPYFTVVFVWATTPFAVKYSSLELGFIPGVSLRIIAAAIAATIILKVMRKPLIKHPREWFAYAAGALSFFPTMLLVYFAAQYLDSGLISVLFGVTPFFVGVFSIVVLGENPFNGRRILALAISVVGLLVIHTGQLDMGAEAIKGFICILLSVLLFALSTVVLKVSAAHIEPVRQMSGSLIVAAPFFAITLMFLGDLPDVVTPTTLIAMLYLIVFGSIVAGLAFMYVLNHCAVITVSLIPLITPVFAMTIGFVFGGERMDTLTLIGCGIVIFSLAVYQGLFASIVRFRGTKTVLE